MMKSLSLNHPGISSLLAKAGQYELASLRDRCSIGDDSPAKDSVVDDAGENVASLTMFAASKVRKSGSGWERSSIEP